MKQYIRSSLVAKILYSISWNSSSQSEVVQNLPLKTMSDKRCDGRKHHGCKFLVTKLLVESMNTVVQQMYTCIFVLCLKINILYVVYYF